MKDGRKRPNPCRLVIRNGYYHGYVVRGEGRPRVRRSLATSDRRLAEQRLRKLAEEVWAGRLDEISSAAKLTLGEWVADYNETHLIGRAPEGARKALRDLNAISEWLGPNRRLNEITAAELIRVLCRRWPVDGTRGLAQKNRGVALLKHFFNEAVRRELLEKSPAQCLRKARENPKPSRTLSLLEIKAVLREMSPKLRALFLLGISSGLRPGELLQLRWKHLTIDPMDGSKWIQLHNAPDLRTKSRKDRKVPLPEEAWIEIQRLRGRKGDERLLFEGPRGGKVWNFRREWRAIVAKLGLTGFSPHGMRRTYGTLLIRNSTPITDIQELLGHADVTTTRRYLDTNDEQLKRSVTAGLAQVLEFIPRKNVGGTDTQLPHSPGSDVGDSVSALSYPGHR